MRTSWWACIVVGVLTCSAAYLLFNQSLPTASPGTSEQSERHLLDQKPEQPLAYNDERRLQDVDPAPAGLEPDQLSNAQKEARLEDAADPGAIDHSELSDTKKNLSYLAYYAYSELPPRDQPGGYRSRLSKGHPVRDANRRNQAGGRRIGTGLRFHEDDCKDRVWL